MSNIKSNIFDSEFDTYGEALDKRLNDKGLSKKWLAKRINDGSVKTQSLQSQISRWLKGEPVGDSYQNRINNTLDILIEQQPTGKWIVKKLEHSQDRTSSDGGSYDFEKKVHDLSRLPKEGKVEPPSTEEELVRQLEAAQSLIRLAIDNLKKK